MDDQLFLQFFFVLIGNQFLVAISSFFALIVGHEIDQNHVLFFIITTGYFDDKQENKSSSEKATGDGNSCHRHGDWPTAKSAPNGTSDMLPPQPIYISSLFPEAVHLLPQYELFSGSKDEATRVATIICSLSSVSVTVVGIAAQYTYTMFKFMNVFWERAVWIHGANVAYFVVGSICLVSALLSHPQQELQRK